MTKLHLYNTLTRKKEEFIPIIEGKVSMYACGTTPYKPPHVGHAMQAVFSDVMRRYFEFLDYKVKYVRNYTDIDDKIINEAKEINMAPLELSQKIIEESDIAFDALSIKRAHFEPKVSEHIDGIIEMSRELIEKGSAYATPEGNVYFKVRSFPDYGKLSGQKVDQLRVGVRKQNKTDKDDPVDFALWKSAKEGEIFWDSPWGKGRPGWHIECSVMSSAHLGNHFDIHGGGADLVFPHHENEIAQSEACHDGVYTNYWVHNGLLMVGKEKMSKSLKNDTSIKAWLKRYHPDIVRYLLISNHYRSNVQFDENRYQEAEKVVYRIYRELSEIGAFGENEAEADQESMDLFRKNMDNDFNTVEVVAQLHGMIPKLSGSKQMQKAFYEITNVLGIFQSKPEEATKQIMDQYFDARSLHWDEIGKEIYELRIAREDKDYEKSDKIRNNLEKKGVKVIITEDNEVIPIL